MSLTYNNKMTYRAKDPRPPPTPRRFLYLRETQSWRWEGGGEEGGEEGEGEKVSLLTHATASGVGKNTRFITARQCYNQDRHDIIKMMIFDQLGSHTQVGSQNFENCLPI